MKILIVDDDKLITSAMSTILKTDSSIKEIYTANSFIESIEKYKNFNPDIVLMDIRMGEKSGLDALEEIKKIDKNAKIIILTTFSDDNYIKKSIDLGSCGYLIKSDFENIIPAIHSVYRGQLVYDKDVFQRIPKLSEDKNNFMKNLTKLEVDICNLISEGKSNREIANILAFSEGTIRNYVSKILAKLDISDRTKLAIYLITGKKE